MGPSEKKLYNQVNKVHKFYLETKLANYNQGNLTVQEFYSRFLTLWLKETQSFFSLLPIPDVLWIQEKSHINQFLVNLHPKLEVVRGVLKNRETTLTLEKWVQEVLREELWLHSYGIINNGSKTMHPRLRVLPFSLHAMPKERILPQSNALNAVVTLHPKKPKPPKKGSWAHATKIAFHVHHVKKNNNKKNKTLENLVRSIKDYREKIP